MPRKSNADTRIYVLDTNILLHEPLAFLSFKENDVVVPMTVLEELDYIKDSKKDVARDARVCIRAMEDLLRDASPDEMLAGVPLSGFGAGENRPTGTLSIYADLNMTESQQIFASDENDNRIINVALHLQTVFASQEVVLVTKDINMRLKAKGAGLAHVEDYRTDQLISDIKYLTRGYHQFEGDFWERVKSVDSRSEGRDTIHTVPRSLLPEAYINEFLLDESNQFAGLVESMDSDQMEILDLGYERLMSRHAWGINPKNIGQAMALHSLLDPHIDLVILTGPAGSGKTLLALAAALEMVVERNMYDKIIVTRNTPEIAESIGFLPGTEEEKMAPWLAAITDSLEVLHKHDENTKGSMSYIMEKANIQFKSVNFMRGRSIQNSIVILDESQNLTASQLKTIITRCGEGTKLICSGNLAQIDSNYLSAVTSGLTYLVEKFKDFSGSATINLDGVVRSRLADFAEHHL
ncbi:MAG: PhoH family protein [Pseudomonadota bacterium]|uniref:Ribonuclease n=1 Tax=Alteromonas alba TaxID=2079529 RepID=A0A2S9V7J3_9ALTE|nr:PhoH family protein [Alteromonas alba]MEC9261389.1 PhoH family protein [Pseudomonadota bacterium]PRO72295.1 ribonuclease [Alteromonas alba]HCB09795.1 PhoH family protein [Alteromonas sp.]HCL13446.1 PhoH family protein [Alteromonas sp.]|tara:strand:- start:9415 stop:10812 length:1398 start_codon:yes stop_codon:yes gene_type:complete